MKKLVCLFVLSLSVYVVSAQSDRSISQAEIQRIIEVSEAYICNLSWLASPEWKQFKQDIQSEALSSLSLDEYRVAFWEKAKVLPFTHYYLRLSTPLPTATNRGEAPAAFELEELDPQTALLHVRSFISDATGMVQAIQEIEARKYQHLIIDLRDNTGGTLDAAVVLSRYITNKPIDAGVYLTRKWFEQHEGYPSPAEINTFPFLKDMTYAGIKKAYAENAAFRMVLPPHENPTFQGKVYILTNSITASTCEPLVDLMKKEKLATIVGRRTAGAMLSGVYFTISEELKLFLPNSDYMTAEGTRIDKVGIEPHVSVRSEKALEYVLEELAKP